MNGKRRWLFTGLLLPVLAITGCSFLRNAEKIATAPDPVVVGSVAEEQAEEDAAEQKAKEEEQQLISELQIPEEPEQDERDATRAKGIYISAYVAGTPALVDNLLAEFDQTEANALVIDFKDDFGEIPNQIGDSGSFGIWSTS